MTLAGFKATNHPQQTAKRGASDVVDDRGTDQAYFDSLSERFRGFTLDVAAAEHNAKCERFFTREQDGLKRTWRGRVWCNPPYSRTVGVSTLGMWVEKAWTEWRGEPLHDYREHLGGGACWRCGPRKPLDLIVMLVPANRTEQGWWQNHVEPYRDRPASPLRVEFLPGRMRFDRPDWTPGPKGDRPPFGCALLIWERTPTPTPRPVAAEQTTPGTGEV